ncbi:hypothetical protein HNQ91_000420 [Filimonas zeae]|uniref:ABC-three component systems C-terminal domain-containing protein n=1 Tax=Filimonas zeae TaxID=1737353 RepID=A0A917IQ10_9BACT|nr:ABC-three component system protein [Filimonas zeae]MDR6337398.1 hypothetical protein [Filimonas zeae]GGH58414.1 hypothetical protein GCM10011379_04120 [Filimonas zeae]
MDAQRKALARKFFKLLVYQADGSRFEDVFTSIMNYCESGFQQIKPWGNIGDRKNDGYIKESGTFFQVYAPEDVTRDYPTAVKKAKDDFSLLLSQWEGIKEYYFVLNDKFKGVNADCEQALSLIVKKYKLRGGGLLTPKVLENKLFELSEDQIMSVVGFLPSEEIIQHIDFSILSEVIGFIMGLQIDLVITKIEFPNWDRKIAFNKLSPKTNFYLNLGSQNIGALNTFLGSDPFLAEALQEKISGIYQKVKEMEIESSDEYSGDYIFWTVIDECCPKKEVRYQHAVMTIIAKYFESCDVFEIHPTD